MTWKLYGLLSGGAFVVTYLMSGQGALPPARPHAAAAAAPKPRSTAEVDIQELADRLEAHARGDVNYTEPKRNPFAFAAAPRPVVPKQVIPPKVVELPPVPVPVTPTISLSGIASDHVNGVLQRTAIFSSASGMVMAHEGDTAAGYRVVSIDENAATVESGDGSTFKLSLSRP